MANPANHGTIIGRVSQDIKEFPNADGSKSLLVNIAVDDNFKSGADQKVQTNYVPVRVFLSNKVNGRGSWDRVHNGDLIAVDYRIKAQPYVKDGQNVYPVTLEVEGFPLFLENKATVDARAARKAVAAQAAQTAPEAPAAEQGETAEQKVARLEAELAAAQGGAGYSTDSPFPA